MPTGLNLETGLVTRFWNNICYNSINIPPKPYESWTLNTSIWDWEAPVEKPTNGLYEWNESTTEWDKID